MNLVPDNVEAEIGRLSRRWQERKLAIATLLLGVMFILNGRAFEPGAPLAVIEIRDGDVWGIIFALIGLGRLILLQINGNLATGPHWRWGLSLFCLAFVWLPLTAGYWLDIRAQFGWPSVVLSAATLGGEYICFFALSAVRAFAPLPTFVERLAGLFALSWRKGRRGGA